MNKELQIQTRLLFAEKYFSTPRYASKVKEARYLFLLNRHVEAQDILNGLPTKESLLKSLVERLKGKSVYKTLRKILNGDTLERYTALKGLLSLGVHTVIECEKGRDEYMLLLVDIYEKIGALMYDTETIGSLNDESNRR